MNLTIKQMTGAVAMWAVRQSPYAVPQNLEEVLRQFYVILSIEADSLSMLQFESSSMLEQYLSERLRSIPAYLAWNQPKRPTKAAFKFVSRFDAAGHPDDDFIDISALEGNVARSLEMEERELA